MTGWSSQNSLGCHCVLSAVAVHAVEPISETTSRGQPTLITKVGLPPVTYASYSARPLAVKAGWQEGWSPVLIPIGSYRHKGGLEPKHRDENLTQVTVVNTISLYNQTGTIHCLSWFMKL